MSNDYSVTFEEFASLHELQLQSLEVPESKWKCLYRKLSELIFDAGDDFMYLQEESEVNDEESDDSGDDYEALRVFTRVSMDPDDDEHIYLIDHAFTYSLDIVKKALEEHDSTYERICCIMNLNQFGDRKENIYIILRDMWKYNQSYVLKDPKKSNITRWWFILDDFGSAIKHAEEPNFIIAPFVYTPSNATYSLLFPKVKVGQKAEVTRAYPRFKHSLSEEMKAILKHPWEKCDLSEIDFNQVEPSYEYLTSGRYIETLPDGETEIPSLTDIKQIKIYSDYPEISEHLTLPNFEFTDDKDDAHILWLCERVFDYRPLADLSTNTFYINQFPSEQVLINKDLLAIVCRRNSEGPNFDMLTLNSFPSWLPTTFSLLTELPNFVSYFQNREKRQLDNTWIVKPFNLARGMDIFITDNLDQIIRLTELRPMVACKYISDPVLFPSENKGLVKMDLRFIVLLKSIQNFELFVYKRFWLRFANKAFSMDDFNDYEKHFTVMNYSDYPLEQMFCHDFIEMFEDHYKSYKWCDIEASIYKMIKDIFIAAAMKEHPLGIGTYAGSRAMYGLDIMLEWDRSTEVPTINPKIIEVNWLPDCKRACQYYPEYYDDIFSVLFLDDIVGKNVVQL